MHRQPPPTPSMACSSPLSPGELGLPAPVVNSRDWPARCSPAPATSCRLSRSHSCSRRAVPSTPSSGPAASLPAVRGSPITNPPPHRPQPSVASDPPTTYATMVGSTAAPPPSPHRDCPTEILDGDDVPPLPPSRVEAIVSPSVPLSIGAVVSSPSTLVRAAATKNKGHASIEEIAAAATLCALYPVTQDPHQGCGVPGEKQRLPKPPPKKRLRSPLVVPVVGSPGVNVVLSQASPRYGVKRSSPTPPQIPCLPCRNKKRKLKFEIWNDFDPVYDGNKLKLSVNIAREFLWLQEKLVLVNALGTC